MSKKILLGLFSALSIICISCFSVFAATNDSYTSAAYALGSFGIFLYIGILALIPLPLALCFKKKGEKWWKAYIPIYGSYCEYKFFDCTWIFWGLILSGIFIVFSCGSSILEALSGNDAVGALLGGIGGLGLLAVAGFGLVSYVILAVKTSKKFHKDTLFTILQVIGFRWICLLLVSFE